MYTTVSIANIGSPPDDPTCPLPATLYVPTVFPCPCIIGVQAAGFQDTGVKPDPILRQFADLGFMGLFAHCRLMNNPITGQTTDGKYHQQTDDIKIAIRYMRSNPLGHTGNGFVGIFGGSGSAHHALYSAIDGVKGDDKSDAAICMSPVTDMGDREADVHNSIINIVTVYGRTTDLPTLTARSPITLNLSTASPILHYNGDNENMPLSMLTRFSSAMNGVPGYNPIQNTGTLGTLHSFDMWDTIGDSAISWMQGQVTQYLLDQSYGTTYSRYMKTFRIVTVDDTGTRTQDIVSYDMIDAVQIAFGNLKTLHRNSIRAVTCTTL